MRCEIYTPFAEAVSILLSRCGLDNGKFEVVPFVIESGRKIIAVNFEVNESVSFISNYIRGKIYINSIQIA